MLSMGSGILQLCVVFFWLVGLSDPQLVKDPDNILACARALNLS